MTASSSITTADSIGSSNPFLSSLESSSSLKSTTANWGDLKFGRETIKIQRQVGILSIQLREKPFQERIEEQEVRKMYMERELTEELRQDLINNRIYSRDIAKKNIVKMDKTANDDNSWNDHLNMY